MSILLGLVMLCFSSTARAEFTAVSAGVQAPTVLGDNTLTFTRYPGAVAQFWWASPAILGEKYQAVVSLSYQPYPIRGVTNVWLKQIGAFVNIEWRSKDNTFFAKPYMSIGPGLTYSWIDFPYAGATLNGAFSFAAQTHTGISMDLFSNLTLDFETPFQIVVSTNSIVSWAFSFLLRHPI